MRPSERLRVLNARVDRAKTELLAAKHRLIYGTESDEKIVDRLTRALRELQAGQRGE